MGTARQSTWPGSIARQGDDAREKMQDCLMRLALPVVLIAALVSPAAASAAGVATIGEGSKPGVAVDAAGTAYIAWNGPEVATSSLQFCRKPRAAAVCDVRTAIPISGNSLSRPFVSVSGSRVTVSEYRYQEKGGDLQGVHEWISGDGGASFDAGRQIGTIPFDEGVQGPGDTLSVATDAFNEGEVFQNMPLSGTTSAFGTRAGLSGDHPYRGTVGLLDASTPLLISTSGGDDAQFRRYSGSGDVNDAANWTPPVDIGSLAYPKLAGGPSGLVVVGGLADRSLVARKWNGTTFGAAARVAPNADSPNAHLTQDAAGRFHSVFNRFDADGLHLDHGVSDNGSTWRVGTVLIQQVATDGGIGNPRAAVAPDHIGVVVWEAGAPRKEIRVTAIGPDAPKPVVRAAGTATVKGTRVIAKIKGKLVPPNNLTAAQACGAGKVKLTLLRGKKTVDAHKARVAAGCSFKETRKFPRSRLKSAKKLTLKASFLGNGALASAKRSGKVKVR